MPSLTTSYAADDIMMVKEGKMSAQGFIASEETRYFLSFLILSNLSQFYFLMETIRVILSDRPFKQGNARF